MTPEEQEKRREAEEVVAKTQADSKRLIRILARLQTHIEDIDPKWSERNVETQSAVVSIAEGYGTLLMYINRVNQGISSQESSAQLGDLSKTLVSEAERLKEIAKGLASTEH